MRSWSFPHSASGRTPDLSAATQGLQAKSVMRMILLTEAQHSSEAHRRWREGRSWRAREYPGKPERINFLVSPAEKREIQETSKVFGLTVTRYLLQLHRVTRAMVESRKGRAAERG